MCEKTTELHNDLRRLLLKLPEDGQQFASLITRTLESVLGQRVWASRGGSQFGGDMGTAAYDGPGIRVEAKRYSNGSKLKTRELLGEIAEAIDYYPSLELWLLATCAEVPEQVRMALDREGSRRGIGIDILDLSPSLHCKLPRLLVEASTATIAFFRESLGEAAADQIARLLGRYRVIWEGNPLPLLNPACLFDLAADRARASFEEARAHAAVAQKRFGQCLHGRSFVARQAAATELNRWRASDNPPEGMLVLCGEEGDGKTWAVSEWLAGFVIQHDAMPVFLSSRDASILRSVDAGISAFIHELFPGTDEAHWKKRVERWISTPSIACRLILVLDGLNEQPAAPWRRIIDSLFAPDRKPSSILGAPSKARAKLPMIVTCRTGFWRTHLADIPRWRLEMIELEPFSEHELRMFLRQHGRRLEDFSPEVWRLLRKPRYSSLVVEHYDLLVTSSDITIDRLLYEDWKHRWKEKTDFPLDDLRFQRLLKDLAAQSLQGKRTHGLGELRQFLPADHDERILTELVTGGVLTQAPSGYKVVPARLHHALGLLLLSHMTEMADEESAEEILATYLEPSGHEAHASILMAAIFGASLTNTSPMVVRLLFGRLFSLQNLLDEVRHRVQAYFPAFPVIYRDLAEEFVAMTTLDRNAFRAIEATYYKWCDVESLSDLMAQHAHHWLATAGVHSPSGEPEDGQYEKQLAQLVGAPPQPGTVTVVCVQFRLVEADHLHLLHGLALSVLSARATTIAPEILSPLALLTALQKHSLTARASWLVRFLESDRISDLVAQIEEMLKVERPAYQEAAFNAARLLPDGRAADLQRRSTYSQREDDRIRRNSDPCKTGIYLWRSSDCHACLQRTDIEPEAKAANLAYHAKDPSFRLPPCSAEGIRSLLRNLLSSIDPAKLHGPYMTRDLTNLERWTPAFARWIPTDFARVSRQHWDHLLGGSTCDQIAESSRAPGRRELGSRELAGIALIITRRNWLGLRQFWKQWVALPLEQRVSQTGSKLDVVESDIFRILLLCAGSGELAKLIRARPATAFNDKRLIDVLPLALQPDHLRTLWSDLFSDRNQLVEKLVLLSLEAVALTTEQRRQLVEIANEQNNDDARTHVCILALLSGDHELVRMLIDAGTGLLFEFVSESYWIPSRAIPAEIGLSELHAISPALLSHVIENRPEPTNDQEFAAMLRDFASSECSMRECHRTPRAWCPFSLPTVRRALAADAQLTDDLIARLEDPGARSPLEHSYWLYYAVCEHLLESSSEAAEDLLDRLIEHSYRGGKSEVTVPHNIVRLMARHQHHPSVALQLAACLNECATDAALQSFSLSFVPPQDTWLWNRIASDSICDRPILVARALTLAGFSQDTDRAIRILEEQGAQTSGWVDQVRRLALATATRDYRARHWFTAFLSRKGRAESWAAFQLFLTCVDRRFDTWLWSTLERQGLSYRGPERRVRHLRVNHQSINEQIEKSEKELKERFCHSQIDHSLFPWRSDWTLSSGKVRRLIAAEEGP